MSLIDERERVKQHLAELEPFLGGLVYAGWEAARAARLLAVETEIVEGEPMDRKTEIESFKLRGERRLLLDLANQFQDVRETLRSRLDEIEELLQPNATSDKPDNE